MFPRTLKLAIGAFALAALNPAAMAGQQASLPPCNAPACEDLVVILTALDSLLRRPNHLPCALHPPRVLRTLHLDPFRDLNSGTLSTPVARFDFFAVSQIERTWPGALVVDSAEAVDPSRTTLRAGGCLYVVAPVVWQGSDRGRVQLAEYPLSVNFGAQFFVVVARRDSTWRVTTIQVGLQN